MDSRLPNSQNRLSMQYIRVWIKINCASKAVSEDAIYTAICETINTVFLSQNKLTTSLERLIENHLDVDGVQGKIDDFNKMLQN